MRFQRRSAFTIIELTIALTIAAALLAIVLPRAAGFVDRIEVRGAVTEIESAFSLARHVAIARAARATLDIDVPNRTLLLRVGAEPIVTREVGAAHGVGISSNRSSFTYSPIGVGYGAGNLTLIVSRNSVEDTVIVSRLGRVRH